MAGKASWVLGPPARGRALVESNNVYSHISKDLCVGIAQCSLIDDDYEDDEIIPQWVVLMRDLESQDN